MLVAADLRSYRVETALDNRTSLSIRAIRPDDKHRLVEHFERLGPESHYRRFSGFHRSFTPEELQYMTNPNFLEYGAIVAMVRDSYRDEYIVGEGCYQASPDGRFAEFALSVLDPYQRRGIGSLLLLHLARLAGHWGVNMFQADVLASNRNALSFLVRRGFQPLGSSAGMCRLSLSLGQRLVANRQVDHYTAVNLQRDN
jgi:GNAT superfamily N-acetyltransferase